MYNYRLNSKGCSSRHISVVAAPRRLLPLSTSVRVQSGPVQPKRRFSQQLRKVKEESRRTEEDRG